MVLLTVLGYISIVSVGLLILGFKPSFGPSHSTRTGIKVADFLDILNRHPILYWLPESQAAGNASGGSESHAVNAPFVPNALEIAEKILKKLTAHQYWKNSKKYLPGTEADGSQVKFLLPKGCTLKEFFEFTFRNIEVVKNLQASNNFKEFSLRFRETATFSCHHLKIEKRNESISIADLKKLLTEISTDFFGLPKKKWVATILNAILDAKQDELLVFVPQELTVDELYTKIKDTNFDSLLDNLSKVLRPFSKQASSTKLLPLMRAIELKYLSESCDNRGSIFKVPRLYQYFQVCADKIFVIFQDIPVVGLNYSDYSALGLYLLCSLENEINTKSRLDFGLIDNEFYKTFYAAYYIPDNLLEYSAIETNNLLPLIQHLLNSIRRVNFTASDFEGPDSKSPFMLSQSNGENFLECMEIFNQFDDNSEVSTFLERYTEFVGEKIKQLEEREEMIRKFFQIFWEKSTLDEFNKRMLAESSWSTNRFTTSQHNERESTKYLVCELDDQLDELTGHAATAKISQGRTVVFGSSDESDENELQSDSGSEVNGEFYGEQTSNDSDKCEIDSKKYSQYSINETTSSQKEPRNKILPEKQLTSSLENKSSKELKNQSSVNIPVPSVHKDGKRKNPFMRLWKRLKKYRCF